MLKTTIEIRERARNVGKKKRGEKYTSLDCTISEELARRLYKKLSNIKGVKSVRTLMGDLAVIVFPYGFEISGEYNPCDVYNLVTNSGCFIIESKIEHEGK